MLRSGLCNYSVMHRLVSETVIITGEGADDAVKRLDEINKGAMFKNFTPFIDCISEKNNTK